MGSEQDCAGGWPSGIGDGTSAGPPDAPELHIHDEGGEVAPAPFHKRSPPGESRRKSGCPGEKGAHGAMGNSLHRSTYSSAPRIPGSRPARVSAQTRPRSCGVRRPRRVSSTSCRNQVERATCAPCAYAVRRAALQKTVEVGLHGHPRPHRRAPVLHAPLGQQFPAAVRVRADEMRVGVDPHGVVPALTKLRQGLVPVLVARAGPAALQPGEVPHGDGERPGHLSLRGETGGVNSGHPRGARAAVQARARSRRAS